MSVGNYTIQVRNSNFALVGQVDLFSSLDFVQRYNYYGTFALEIGADNPQAANLVANGAGIIILRNNVVIFSGPVRRIQFKGYKENLLMISGVDDLFWLTGRQCWPTAAYDTGSVTRFANAAYDTRSGVAESIIKQYVDYNGGPHAISYRQIPGLTIETDSARGTSVAASARFDEMLAKDWSGLLQLLALSGGLGYRVVQQGTGLQFQCYVPADKSANVKFSRELGNLADYTYTIDASAVENYVVVAGQGDGTARAFKEGSNGTSVTQYGRFEQFIDKRSISDLTQLTQAVSTALTAGAQQLNFNGVLAETSAVQYQRDFALGDKVAVVVNGQQIYDLVREIGITLDPKLGETITPAIGTPNAGALTNLFGSITADIPSLLVRVGYLERSK